MIRDQEIISCYHCGEDCLTDLLRFDDKSFCCNGCKLVFEILIENDLCSYYDLAASPGLNQKAFPKAKNRFDYLDDKDVIEKLLDFSNENISHISFRIPFIHCASCIWLLENLHKLHTGIISGRVDFLKKRVQIRFDHDAVSLKGLVQLLTGIGYEPSISLSDLEEKTAVPTHRGTLNRLAVAGFCFGNMMFFSLPDYFSEAALLGNGFGGLFNYLNVLLALPVFFYSANGYYKSAWLALRSRTINMDVPIVMGILALFIYSLYNVFIMGEAGYMDTLGGLLFFLLIGKVYQQKTFDTLTFDRDYKSYFPMAVTKIVQDIEEVVPLSRLLVGDFIRVRDQELIPADSILLKGNASIDYSFVTGEEIPVPIKQGQLIYAGGRQLGSSIFLKVQKHPSQGYLTGLWDKDNHSKEKDHSLETLANKISFWFTIIILLVAFSTLAIWSFTDFAIGLKAFTAVLIIACPCALAMSTPFTLGNTLRLFGKSKLYLKNAGIVEKMAMVDSVIFDKTGTLTSTADATLEFVGEELSKETKQVIKSMVNQSTHPLSNRINSWLKGEKQADTCQVREIPGKGIQAYYKGQEILLGSSGFTGISPAVSEEGGNQVFLTLGGYLLGYFHIQSGYREGVGKLLNQLGSDYFIHLLTGDQNHEEGILKRIFGNGIKMNFNKGPAEKLEFIKSLNRKGAKTLMVGDGLNDAGALMESHVGIAITDQITHFSPASDAIMDAESLGKLPVFLAFTKTSRNIIKASFGLSFAYNIVGVSFAVQGMLSPLLCAILMPLSSISVVIFTTLSTNYIAIKNGLIDKSAYLWK